MKAEKDDEEEEEEEEDTPKKEKCARTRWEDGWCARPRSLARDSSWPVVVPRVNSIVAVATGSGSKRVKPMISALSSLYAFLIIN